MKYGTILPLILIEVTLIYLLFITDIFSSTRDCLVPCCHLNPLGSILLGSIILTAE